MRSCVGAVIGLLTICPGLRLGASRRATRVRDFLTNPYFALKAANLSARLRLVDAAFLYRRVIAAQAHANHLSVNIFPLVDRKLAQLANF